MLHWIKSLDRILRGEATRPADLRRGTIDVPLGGLSVVILLLGVVYGACMGTFAVVTRWGTPKLGDGLLQVLSSALKVPALLFLTLLVTFPSLYVFNALVGSRLNFRALLRLLVAAMGVMMALLASFGTIVVFFSVSTESYAFMVLLNVLLFAASGFLGLGFLLQTLHRLAQAAVPAPAEDAVPPGGYVSPAQPEAGGGGPPPLYSGPPGAGFAPPLSPGPLDRLRGQQDLQSVKTVFRIWVVVFGLVGAQMGWMLRPFVLHPRSDFVAFRERDSNFFQAVTDKIGDLFGASDWDGRSRPRDRRGDGRTNPPPPAPPTAEAPESDDDE